ncbi:CheR family methyltransferase [Francisella tularensis]|uniref:CheR family methyltransferase n=1 Tax=Francisella tularensis TaxID=263 RepID=UPI0008F4F4A5|nr:CheR family methyltransferase [Francisella tularensis]APA82501.1 Chemotaxis protein methyltransferase CheR [Francisella tularensis subsp. novicida PA10-7858]
MRVKYIIGIGASAGGLEALEHFFKKNTKIKGVAFVVVQHLSPTHKSLMPELLKRYTDLPIKVIKDKELIQPNIVYLMPAGTTVEIFGDSFKLTPRKSHEFNLPVDLFFSSMARRFRKKAIAVILSGTGSDGTRGCLAVNSAGGFVLVQDPSDAKFDGMPASAISTGVVDVIAAAKDLDSKLYEYLQKPDIKLFDIDESKEDKEIISEDEAFDGVLRLLLQYTGIGFANYKPATVLRRIERRMQINNLTKLENYRQFLLDNPEEIILLQREILIPVTSFFRDESAFEALQLKVVSKIIETTQSREPIRVWCAGCSTGEEAYSLAMLFLEAFDKMRAWHPLKVFGTDVNDQNIAIAGTGAYPESIVKEVSKERLERFFDKKGSQYFVKRDLRSSVVFAKHDLLKDPAFTKMNLVSCRNTLIYFKNEAQSSALNRLTYAAGNGGYLFLGSSESISNIDIDYKIIDNKSKIFQCFAHSSLTNKLIQSTLTPYQPSIKINQSHIQTRKIKNNQEVVNLAEKELLGAYAQPTLLLNSANDILHIFGKAQKYLVMPSGPVSMELSKVLHPQLISSALALIFKAIKDHISLQSDLLNLEVNQEQVLLRLHVRPLEYHGSVNTLLTFEEKQIDDHNIAKSQILNVNDLSRVELLQQELTATRERLQATIEELETSNEELQATNEELMASNEELQSANEELQSVNEELSTINSEYQEKLYILNRLNADLDCMMQAVGNATIFLDHDLLITRFTPEAINLFKLRDSDVGRPLNEIKNTFDCLQLDDDIILAQRKKLGRSRQIKTEDGKSYLMKVLPYQLDDSSRIGVVISFTDISHVVGLKRLQAVIDALSAHMVVLDTKGNIVMINRAWQQFAQANGNDSMCNTDLGANYIKACLEEFDGVTDLYANKAKATILKVLEGSEQRGQLIYPCHSPTQQRWFMMDVNAIHGIDDLAVVISHINISHLYNKEYLSDKEVL